MILSGAEFSAPDLVCKNERLCEDKMQVLKCEFIGNFVKILLTIPPQGGILLLVNH